MISDDFDISGFSLKEDELVPTTGIKINLNVKDSIENKSAFRFVDATASKNADLDNLIVSSGTTDEENPDNSTYKEYELNPKFDKDTLNYELELLENIDELNLEPILSDTKSSIKIKVPQRDNDNNLVYDSDGVTIIYEEKDISNNTSTTVTLNKLGEPDTIILLMVTAEDNKTVKNYNLVVKRPFGVIKGKIYAEPMSAKGIYKASVRIYKSNDVSKKIDWSTITSGENDTVHEDLMTLKSYDVETNDDGTYEIKIIPGEYDVLLDKAGYLDHIYTSKTVNAGDIIDLGYKELLAGDVNKDGSIQILDMSELMKIYGANNTDPKYDIKYDFNDDMEIQILDLSYLMKNYSISRVVE